jgi:hypothetical protein
MQCPALRTIDSAPLFPSMKSEFQTDQMASEEPFFMAGARVEFHAAVLAIIADAEASIIPVVSVILCGRGDQPVPTCIRRRRS